jgi:hypothetical protein
VRRVGRRATAREYAAIGALSHGLDECTRRMRVRWSPVRGEKRPNARGFGAPTIRPHAPVCGLRPERFAGPGTALLRRGRLPAHTHSGDARSPAAPRPGQAVAAAPGRVRGTLGLDQALAPAGSDRALAGLARARAPWTAAQALQPGREASRSSSLRRPPSGQSCRAAASSSTPWVLSMEDGCY